MKKLYLSLEDGAVFEGQSVNDALQTAGLLSFYTGVVGYQEVITDPANLGKIILFTYPLIGNYGVNTEDVESSGPKVSGIVTKEYPPYYSNFRATGSLSDYLKDTDTVFGTGFDTRAVLIHLREHGEMLAALADKPMDADAVRSKAADIKQAEYKPENKPLACAQARPRATANVIDLGASVSFYKMLAEMGIDASCDSSKADFIIVSDAPYYTVESEEAINLVKTALGEKPVVGFGHGSAIVAKACEVETRRMSFGDHGVNIPVRFVGGGRNEITAQNHNYEVVPNGSARVLFENLHDGSCEGFVCEDKRAAGINFIPTAQWMEALLKSVGVE